MTSNMQPAARDQGDAERHAASWPRPQRLCWLAILLLAGCEHEPDARDIRPPTARQDPPAASPQVQAPRARPTQRAATTAIEVQTSFEDVGHAVDVAQQALIENGASQLVAVIDWLAADPSLHIGSLQAIATDAAGDIRGRITAVHLLGQLGKPANPALLTVLATAEGQVRRKTAEVLGGVRPVSDPTVSALVDLLRNEEVQTRQTALRALVRIGAPAKPAVPEILALMERETNRTVREQGHAALKKIDPRVTLPLEP